MNTKAILASTLLTAVIAGSAVNAEGRGANSYDNAQATQSAEIVKVSIKTPAADYEVDVNR